MKEKGFLLIGSFGGGNLGDNAILDTIIEIISSKYQLYKIYIPTSNINFIEEKYKSNKNIIPININIRAGALRFTSIQTLLSLFKVEKIFTTAGILFDYNSHRFLRQSFITTLIPLFTVAKILKKEIIGLNVGIVQKSKVGKHLLKYVLNKHDLIYLREPADEEICKKLNINTKRIHAADIVFANDKMGKPKKQLNIHRPIVGVNLNKYIDIQMDNKQKTDYDDFVQVTAENLNRLIEEENVHIVFLSTSYMDEQIHKDVNELIHQKEDTSFPEYEDYEGLIEEISKVDVLIGMRMHALIFATLQSKPVCSLNYNPKVTKFMQQIDSNKHAHEISSLTGTTLYQSIVEILNDYDSYYDNQLENYSMLKQMAKVSNDAI